MIKQEVYVEVGITNFQMDLPAHKGEPLTEFEQKMLDMVNELSLQFDLPPQICGSQKIKEPVQILDQQFSK